MAQLRLRDTKLPPGALLGLEEQATVIVLDARRSSTAQARKRTSPQRPEDSTYTRDFVGPKNPLLRGP